MTCSHFALFVSNLFHLKLFSMLMKGTRDDNRSVNCVATRQTDAGTRVTSVVFIRERTLVDAVVHVENHHAFVSDVPPVPLQTLIYWPTKICFAVCIRYRLPAFHLHLYHLQYVISEITLRYRLPTVDASSSCPRLTHLLIPSDFRLLRNYE
jgi:hypothetical protein